LHYRPRHLEIAEVAAGIVTGYWLIDRGSDTGSEGILLVAKTCSGILSSFTAANA
jgi:hypothetical protein